MFGKETSTFNVKTKDLNKLLKKKKRRKEKKGWDRFCLNGYWYNKIRKKGAGNRKVNHRKKRQSRSAR